MRLSGISRSLAALQVLPSTLTGAIGWKTLSWRQKMFAGVLDETIDRGGKSGLSWSVRDRIFRRFAPFRME